MNIQIPAFICSIAFILLLTACSPQDDVSDTEGTNEFLVNLSDRLNERLPDMVGENTVLESTSGYNSRFTYYYTLLNYTADEIDTDTFISQMKPVLLQNTCTSESLAPLVDQGVTIQYIYSDKDRKEITAIAVSPAECENTD